MIAPRICPWARSGTDHRRRQAELAHHPQMLLVAGALLEQLVGDPRVELGVAGADHVREPGRLVRVRRIALPQLLREPDLRRVGVRHGDAADAALVGEVHRAPVADLGDRDRREALKRRVEVERPAEDLAGARDEREVLARPALALVLLGAVE